MQLLTKVCLVCPRCNNICLGNCIPTAELWHKSFFLFCPWIRELATNKGIEVVICIFTQRTGEHVRREEEGIIRDTLRLSYAGAVECYCPVSSRAMAGLEGLQSSGTQPRSPRRILDSPKVTKLQHEYCFKVLGKLRQKYNFVLYCSYHFYILLLVLLNKEQLLFWKLCPFLTRINQKLTRIIWKQV